MTNATPTCLFGQLPTKRQMVFGLKIDESWWMSNVVAQSRVGDLAASEVDLEVVDTLKQCLPAHSVLVLLLRGLEDMEPDSEAGSAAEEEDSKEEDSAVTEDLVGQEEVSDIRVAAMDLVVKLPLMPLLVLAVGEVVDMVDLMEIDAAGAGWNVTEKRLVAIGNR